MRYQVSIIFLVLAIVLPSNLVGAQSTPSPKPVVSIDDYVAPTDTLFNTYARSIFMARLRRMFSTDPLYRANQTQGIINNLFVRASLAFSAGDASTAETIFNELATERASLGVDLDSYRLATPNRSQEKITPIVSDEAVRLSYLPHQSDGTSKRLQVIIDRIQTESLREIDQSINDTQLDSEAKAANLNRFVEEYGKKSLKTDENLAQKMILVGQLKMLGIDSDLSLLDKQEANLLVRTSKLPSNQLVRLSYRLKSEGEIMPSAGVVQKLADSAPSVRSDLETDLNEIISQIAQAFTLNDSIITTLYRVVPSGVVRASLVSKVEVELETEGHKTKLKIKIEEAEADAKTREALKKELEIKQEARKKEIETKRENEKKAQEVKKESKEKTKIEVSNTPKSDTTSTPKASPTPEVETKELEIKIKNGQFETTAYRVKSGVNLKIKIKNEDQQTRTVVISNGQSHEVKSKGEATATPFVFTSSVTFSAEGVGSGGTITVAE